MTPTPNARIYVLQEFERMIHEHSCGTLVVFTALIVD